MIILLFTQQAFNSITLTINSKVRKETLDTLVAGNLSVDGGVYFNNNYWHFNRNIGDSSLKGKFEYLKILYSNTAKFGLEISEASQDPLSNKADKLCQSALQRLGRLSHAWQDYYAHAVAISYKKGDPDKDTGIISPSSNPYFPDPNMKPSSYGKGGGEHGSVTAWNALNGKYEPGNRAPDKAARRTRSVTFTAEMFGIMLPLWHEACKCTPTVRYWELPPANYKPIPYWKLKSGGL